MGPASAWRPRVPGLRQPVLKASSIRPVTTNATRSRDARRRSSLDEQTGGERDWRDRDELHPAYHGDDHPDRIQDPGVSPLRQAEYQYVQGTKQPRTGRRRAAEESRRREQQDQPVIALHTLKG